MGIEKKNEKKNWNQEKVKYTFFEKGPKAIFFEPHWMKRPRS